MIVGELTYLTAARKLSSPAMVVPDPLDLERPMGSAVTMLDLPVKRLAPMPSGMSSARLLDSVTPVVPSLSRSISTTPRELTSVLSISWEVAFLRVLRFNAKTPLFYLGFN